MSVLIGTALFAAGFGFGLLVRDRRRKLAAENNKWLGETVEAIKGADLHEDVRSTREHAVIDPSVIPLNPGQRATVLVAETLARFTPGKWRIKGPMAAVPLAREAAGVLLYTPEGRRLVRDCLAEKRTPFVDQDCPDEVFRD